MAELREDVLEELRGDRLSGDDHGQIVYVTAARARVFDENGSSPRTEELALV